MRVWLIYGSAVAGTAAKTNRLTMEYTRAMFEADNKHLFGARSCA
jgi:hypothetical protein